MENPSSDDEHPSDTHDRSRVTIAGLSLAMTLAILSLLTLFGIALLEAITDYQLGPINILLMCVLLAIQNFGFMLLVGWAIARK
jgi:hypothetical protein